MDRERISRLEALLARVKARGDEPRTHTNGDVAHAAAGDETASHDHAKGEIQHDSILPPESSTLHALPPPPPGSSGTAFVAPRSDPEMVVRSSELELVPSEPEPLAGDLEPEAALELEPLSDRPPPPVPERSELSVPTRPAFMPLNVHESQSPQRRPATPPPAVPTPSISASSLEEAFEQYELVSEVVEIAPDAEDDSVRPSQRPPVMIDSEFDEAARRHEEELRAAAASDESAFEAPEELQSQQRLVVASPSYPPHGADSGELEVVGEAEIDEVIDPETSELVLRDSEDLPSSHRPTREMSAILESGFDAPPENANRPVLELQHETDEADEIEEPPPSSRRPVSHEEVREAELTFDNDVPSPPLTPPPESGRQVAVPVHADLRGNPEVADLVGAPVAPAVTFGELLEDTLKL